MAEEIEEGTNKTEERKEKSKNNNYEILEDKKEKNTELIKVKVSSNKLTLNQQEELETIEKEIKSQEIKSKEKMREIYVNVFKNILYAIIVMIYFILIIIGRNSIQQNIFITDLKVFSMTLLIATIYIFEKAYKKDSGKLTIIGIEFLMLSICSLLSIRAYMVFNNKFVSIVTSFALLFAIYYVGKAIAGYVKEKKQAKKEVRDINAINKKEL